MNEAGRVVVALTSYAIAIIVTTASAQTLSGITALERSPISPVSVVHEYIPASLVPGQATIPSNLEITSLYRDLVDRMLRRSPTFRRQLLRIAGAQQLTVHLRTVPPPWPRDVRATTQFVRKGAGLLAARIDIAPLNNDVELIAHELEHVIEQLDDINLAAKASQPNSGVHTLPVRGVLFETTRARRIGLQVAQEVQ